MSPSPRLRAISTSSVVSSVYDASPSTSPGSMAASSSASLMASSASRFSHPSIALAGSAKQRRSFDLVDHATSFVLVERWHAKRDVFEDLDEHAAEAEHHDRAEQLVVAHADHALDTALDLLRDEHPTRRAGELFVRG